MRTACALALTLLCSAILNADDGKPRLDGDGEPLPPGARFRLGTRLWRHTGDAWHLAWSPDGKQLAMSNNEGVRILDAARGKVVLTVAESARDAVLAYSPDGAELAIGSMSTGVVVFDPTSGRALPSYAMPANKHLCYSPRGTYIMAAYESDYAVVERKTGKKILNRKTRSEIYGGAFDRDESRLLVASSNGTVTIWDVARQKVLKEWKHPGDGPAVAPDGKHFAVGAKNVIVVDAETLDTKATLQGDDPDDGFRRPVYTSDGKLLIAASQDTTGGATVYVWDAGTYKRRWKLPADTFVMRGLAVDPAGTRVALCDGFNRIWIWDLETGKPLHAERVGHNHEVYAVAWSADGAVIATGSGGSTTHLWNAATGQHQRHLPTTSLFLALSRDSRTLYSGSYSGEPLQEIDVKSGETTQQWPQESPQSLQFAISQNQSRLVRLDQLSADAWRLTTYAFPKMEQESQVDGNGVAQPVTLSPSGKFAAFAVYPEGTKVFCFEQNKAVATLRLGETLEQLAFTPDDRFLLAAGLGVKVFELATGKVVHTFDKHNRPVGALALSSHGRTAVSTDGNTSVPIPAKEAHRIRFWDIATGHELATLSGHEANATSICFSPDGTQLITGLQDASALVWDVPEEARQVPVAMQAIAAGEIEDVWRELSSPEAAAGQRAVRRLVNDPDSAVALLEERLKPVAAPDDKEVQSLIVRLEDDDFKVRQDALQRLSAYGAVIAPHLTAAARDAGSNELRLRCQELLEAAQTLLPLQGERLTAARAVQVLEWIGTERAKGLLVKLAEGAAEAQLTREARGALGRWR